MKVNSLGSTTVKSTQAAGVPTGRWQGGQDDAPALVHRTPDPTSRGTHGGVLAAGAAPFTLPDHSSPGARVHRHQDRRTTCCESSTAVPS
jgi:hypothetical protein